MIGSGIFTSWIFGGKDIKTSVFNKLGLTALFGAVSGFIAFITDLSIGGMDKITGWLTSITQTAWPEVQAAEISSVLALANAVFPLSYAITVFSSLYLLWGIVLLVRWIKSFVPTIAN